MSSFSHLETGLGVVRSAGDGPRPSDRPRPLQEGESVSAKRLSPRFFRWASKRSTDPNHAKKTVASPGQVSGCLAYLGKWIKLEINEKCSCLDGTELFKVYFRGGGGQGMSSIHIGKRYVAQAMTPALQNPSAANAYWNSQETLQREGVWFSET